jgi:hypothetical protein
MALGHPAKQHLPGVGVVAMACIVCEHQELVSRGIHRLSLMRVAAGRSDQHDAGESQRGPQQQQGAKQKTRTKAQSHGPFVRIEGRNSGKANGETT